MCFQAGEIKENSKYSNNDYQYVQTHHCSWCGKEYKGSGYMHVMNQCVNPEQVSLLGISTVTLIINLFNPSKIYHCPILNCIWIFPFTFTAN